MSRSPPDPSSLPKSELKPGSECLVSDISSPLLQVGMVFSDIDVFSLRECVEFIR